jgi:hypothetical protein
MFLKVQLYHIALQKCASKREKDVEREDVEKKDVKGVAAVHT